ncbi:MAG: hypothetical protein KatS3mg014_2385 [Actinomycetota bacterium]|nr:MAG: hypothetical protein KatS3mg014_2385 [Actinomycetota bacterium]
MGTVGVFLLLALGLNIVAGYAGLLDLGYSRVLRRPGRTGSGCSPGRTW